MLALKPRSAVTTSRLCTWNIEQCVLMIGMQIGKKSKDNNKRRGLWKAEEAIDPAQARPMETIAMVPHGHPGRSATRTPPESPDSSHSPPRTCHTSLASGTSPLPTTMNTKTTRATRRRKGGPGGKFRRSQAPSPAKTTAPLTMEELSEGTLTEEAIRAAAGRVTTRELHDVTRLALVIDSSQVSVEGVWDAVPNLHTLTLDGSRLLSFRDLGVGLRHLNTLSLESSFVEDLDGIGALSGLRELRLAHNRVSDMTPLACHATLQILGLERNRVSDMNTLEILSSLPLLYRSVVGYRFTHKISVQTCFEWFFNVKNDTIAVVFVHLIHFFVFRARVYAAPPTCTWTRDMYAARLYAKKTKHQHATSRALFSPDKSYPNKFKWPRHRSSITARPPSLNLSGNPLMESLGKLRDGRGRGVVHKLIPQIKILDGTHLSSREDDPVDAQTLDEADDLVCQGASRARAAWAEEEETVAAAAAAACIDVAGENGRRREGRRGENSFEAFPAGSGDSLSYRQPRGSKVVAEVTGGGSGSQPPPRPEQGGIIHWDSDLTQGGRQALSGNPRLVACWWWLAQRL